eukprot:9981937-Ditylum_brightwellii.AAC.1
MKLAGIQKAYHTASCEIGCTSCLSDRDVWFKAMTTPEDGFKYYAYVLLYVNDVLSIHHDASEALQEIDNFFIIKRELIGDPSMYLDAKLASPSKYLQEAVKNVDNHLQGKYNTSLPKKMRTPYPKNYMPELDLNLELGSSEASFYHSCIRVLRLVVVLG